VQQRLISSHQSVIVAADVASSNQLHRIAEAVRWVPKISALKFGVQLGLDGLWNNVRMAKDILPDVVVIYDHQKAGNDIPDMGAKFAGKLRACGIDAAILFPFAGPETQRVWTESCLGEGLRVLIGGIMTHPKFLVSEGGYISDDAPERIFDLACDQGIKDFVVPGTKIDWVVRLRAQLQKKLGPNNFDLYAPGFISQGGDITTCGIAAGPYFHAIVGSAIYGKNNIESVEMMRSAAIKVTSQLSA